MCPYESPIPSWASDFAEYFAFGLPGRGEFKEVLMRNYLLFHVFIERNA